MHFFNKDKPIHRSDLLWDTSLSRDNISFKVANNFLNYSWKLEPHQSWSTLKRQRAEQIRESYEYIILYFSGGSDSVTVLNAFLDNGIKLDEVVINGYAEIPDYRINGKYALNYLKNRKYNGKTTFVDLSADRLLKIYNNTNLDGFYNLQGSAACNLRAKVDWFEENNLIHSSRRKGKIAHVYGGMTPMIKKINGKYHSIISPKAFMIPSAQYGNVQFFTTEEFPELHCKQCHMLLTYMLANNIASLDESVSEKEAHIIRVITRDEANPALYFSKINFGAREFFINGNERRIINDFYKVKDINLLKRFVESKLYLYLKNKSNDLRLLKGMELNIALE